MTATMTTGERTAIAPPTTHSHRAQSGPKWAILGVVSGLLLMVGAGGVLAPQLGRRESRAEETPIVSDAGFPNVGITDSSYPPGHTSGWHAHPGVHSVVVLSGTLTIYDEHCGRTEYGPGQTYLGGTTPHVARNETLEVLNVAITFVYRPPAENHGQAVPAPTGCELR